MGSHKITQLVFEPMTSEDAARIDSVFRLVDRKVWIVTAAAGERRGGLLATWVSQASIDPLAPVVVIALGVNHFTRELVDASGAFALHLISEEQIELAWRFGLGSGAMRDKLAGLAWRAGKTGSPILDESLAWLECRTFDRHDEGDRIYYWADVVAGAKLSDDLPLSEHELVARATAEQRAQLRAEMNADVHIQRPLYVRRRDQLGGEASSG